MAPGRVVTADVATLVALLGFAAVGWFVGYWRGHEVAESLWRRRNTETRRLLIDALARCARAEEALRGITDPVRLTRREREAFGAIAEAEEER